MALLLFEGFDGNGLTTGKWVGFNGIVSATGGRNGTNGVSMSCNNASCLVSRSWAGSDTIIVGLAVTVHTADPNINQLSLREGGTTHIAIQTKPITGQVILYRNVTQIAASANAVCPASTIQYLEIKTYVHSTLGTVSVRLNGTEIISFSGNTRNGGTGVMDNIAFGSNSGTGAQFRFDDLYVCDTTGSKNNDFLGDVFVQIVRPNGNGNYSQFVGQDSDSTNNYLNVDETTSDGDTTYNQAGTATNKDSYAVGDLTGSNTVLGVQVGTMAKHTGSGGTMRHLVRRSSTDAFGATKTPAASYDHALHLWESDPIASADWTITNFNASEFGVEIVS